MQINSLCYYNNCYNIIVDGTVNHLLKKEKVANIFKYLIIQTWEYAFTCYNLQNRGSKYLSE